MIEAQIKWDSILSRIKDDINKSDSPDALKAQYTIDQLKKELLQALIDIENLKKQIK